jgi:predicted component of type VI protein secretion system
MISHDFVLRRQIDFSVSATHVKSVFLGLNAATSPLPYSYIEGLMQASQEVRLRAPALTLVLAHARINQGRVSLELGIEAVLGESLIDRRNKVSFVHAHHTGRFQYFIYKSRRTKNCRLAVESS